MSSDPSKPLLKLTPLAETSPRPTGRAVIPPKPEPFKKDRQIEKFGPQFDRLHKVSTRDPSGMELRADPTALAPERLLVFEVRGEIGKFADTIRKIIGLELIDEEELVADEEDKAPFLYLMVPDNRALSELLSLWNRWREGLLARGETPWGNLFSLLKDLRTWGPQDRIKDQDRLIFEQELEHDQAIESLIIEVELVFSQNTRLSQKWEDEIRQAVLDDKGKILARERIVDIAYHALLIEVNKRPLHKILSYEQTSIAGLDGVMHIRPQTVAPFNEVTDVDDGGPVEIPDELGDPILAVIDGVPISAHQLLRKHLIVHDPFNLEGDTLVAQRRHGTSMASLIIHGDLNGGESPLPRQIISIPVMGAQDQFPANQLVIGMIHAAIVGLFEGENPISPQTLIINLSLGNRNRPFHGQMSAWARLLDQLAAKYGVLFLISAGNILDLITISGMTKWSEFENAAEQSRREHALRAVDNVKAERRLLSPAESINGVTVGAFNGDLIPQRNALHVDPYPGISMTNPSSALGPGFAKAVKPDILMPGSKEHLTFWTNGNGLQARPAGASRNAGLKVAGPPIDGRESEVTYSSGTSAANALASRTCHRIHDALERAYGDVFTNLNRASRALILKALLIHSAQWPDNTAQFIRKIVGPANNRQRVRQKENIYRYLGYGIVNADIAVACAGDRATFWATGVLARDRVTNIDVPIPMAMAGPMKRPHSLSATLAWFTPANPGRKSYRGTRLIIREPEELNDLGIAGSKQQPDQNQIKRGTIYSRRWEGDNILNVREDMNIRLAVQRNPDQGALIDEDITYGLAITLEMQGVMGIYDEVRQRLGIQFQGRVRT